MSATPNTPGPPPDWAQRDDAIQARGDDPRGVSASSETKGHTLAEVQEAFEQSWSRGTCQRREWDQDNPAWGQCAATTVAFRRIFGGKVLCTTVYDSYRKHEDGKIERRDGLIKFKHFYNEDAQGLSIDLTAIQYSLTAKFHVNPREPYPRHLPFGQEVLRRAIKLEKRVRAKLAKVEATGLIGRTDVYRMNDG